MKLLVRLAAVAAVLGMIFLARAGTEPREAEAGPTNIFMFHQAACLALSGTAGQPNCLAGSIAQFAANIGSFAQVLGDEDLEIEPEDFAQLNLDANHLHEDDGLLFVVAFVDDVGHTLIEIPDDAGTIIDNNGTARGNSWFCTDEWAAPATPDDCDPNSSGGDGVIVFGICGGNELFQCGLATPDGADRGAATLEVRQEGFIMEQDYTVVGEPDEIEVTFFETTVSAGIVDPDTECPLAASVAGFTEALGRAEKTVAIARVKDSDGTDITGAWVQWDPIWDDENITDDAEMGTFAGEFTPTLDLGSFGFGAPNIFCGTLNPGLLDITVTNVPGLDAPAAASNLDPNASFEDQSVEITIVDLPDNVALSVAPQPVVCDGVNAGTVSATVTTADGSNVANGTRVFWSVVALGTANPLSSTTTDGVATTSVVPLAGADLGVTVLATVFDGPATRFAVADDDLEDNDEDGLIDEQGERDPDVVVPNPDKIDVSTIVQCTAGAPPPPGTTPGVGPGAQTPTGTIRPPDTGSGGDVDGRGALSVWPVIGLALAGAALAGARLAFRRA